MRMAEHKRKLAIFEQEKAAHKKLMAERKKKQVAVWKAAQKEELAEEERADLAGADIPHKCDSRHPAYADWAADLERIATRCGAGSAQVIFVEGYWFDIQGADVR